MITPVSCMVLIVITHLVKSFNLSPKFHIIISDPSQQEGSYFGYLVHLRSGIDRYASSIVVGAPKANSTYTTHRQIAEPGVVYQCNIDEFIEITPICYPLLLDPKGEVQPNPKVPLKHKKSHSWLGAALDGQNSRGGRFVACAPRWANQFYLMTKNALLNNGMCYWISDTTDANRTAHPLVPLFSPRLQNFKGKMRKYYGYAFGQAGFSVHMPKADGTELLLGAPGVFNWKGGVIRYKINYEDFSFHHKNFNSIPYTDPTIPNTYYNSRITFDSYFGYSLSSGIFLSDLPTKRWYVGGAPRDAKYKGRVFLFDLRDNTVTSKQEILIKKEFEGQQLGEYFGSSVCATDVNGDGLDDVLIGAPRNSLENSLLDIGDEGAVYVFLNKDYWNFQEQPKLQHKEESRAEFGICISSLGDLDLDGFSDVVVGAPYEDDGRGAIYIYLGSSKGLKPKPSQHIRAIDVDRSLFGFGMSVSKGVDIDKNYYNDLAVGSYLSDSIVLFRAQPVTRLSGKIVPLVSEIGLNTTKLSLNVCILYNGSYVPETAKVAINVQADPVYKRAYFIANNSKFENTINKIMKIRSGNESCLEGLSLDIKVLSQDFSKPLEIRMQYSIHEDKSKIESSFCASCSIIDPSTKSTIKTFVPYSTGCENDVHCIPDLKISAYFTNLSEPFVLGTKRSIFLNVLINNTGEPAFLTRLFVTINDDVSFVETSNYCNDFDKSIVCEIGNVFSSELKLLIFEIDAFSIKPDMNKIEINLQIKSAGQDQNYTNNNISIVLPLISIAELKIISKSSPEQLSFKDKKGRLKSKIDPISQEYIIQNLGPSSVGNSLVHFYFPIMYKNLQLFNIMEPETSIRAESIKCNATDPGFVEDFGEDDSPPSEFSRIRIRRDNIQDTLMYLDDTLDNLSNYDFPVNRTLLLNCSKNFEEITCMAITCELGLLENSQNNAIIKFLIRPILKNVDTALNGRDILQMDVGVAVLPLIKINATNNGRVITTLRTTLIGSLPAEDVPHFWIVLSVAVGLLLMVSIISGLMKFGFFKRAKKDELDLLKERSFDCQDMELY